MKHATAWLMALALISPTQTNAEGQTMTDDQKNVLAAIKTMTSAFENKDITQVMQSYEPSATVVFEPGAPVNENGVLEQMFTHMAMVNPKFSYAQGHEVIVNGDIALHIAPWHMSGQTPEGQAIAQSGLSVAVVRKQSDGSWKMVIDNPHGGRLMAE